MRNCLFLAFVVMLAAGAVGQSGHWEGAVSVDRHELNLIVDLAQDAAGVWRGSMSLPDQKASPLRLSKIVVAGNSVAFSSANFPSFQASVSADGAKMQGFVQLAANRHPVLLTRTSMDALIAPEVKSTPVSKQLERVWQGTLRYGKTWGNMTPPEGQTPEGASFGIRVKFGNGPAGVAIGSLTRMDEEIEMPLDLVTQRGDEVRFEIFSVAGVFIGTLRPTEIVGEWRQLGAEPVPFTLKATGGT